MLFTNSCTTWPALVGQSVPIYPSANTNIPPVIVPYGQTAVFYWQAWAKAWATNNKPPPPANFGQTF